MYGAIPPLPNTPSCGAKLSTGTTYLYRLHIPVISPIFNGSFLRRERHKRLDVQSTCTLIANDFCFVWSAACWVGQSELHYAGQHRKAHIHTNPERFEPMIRVLATRPLDQLMILLNESISIATTYKTSRRS